MSDSSGMDGSQAFVPESFSALFFAGKGRKPTERPAVILQRYELCEDMAQMLTENARNKLMDLGVDEALVLERMHAGLATGEVVSADEALWVVRRLAELLGWELPQALEWRDAATLQARDPHNR